MSTEADIVERLRKHVNDRGGASIDNGAWQMMLDAADEIKEFRSIAKFLSDELTRVRAERDAAARVNGTVAWLRNCHTEEDPAWVPCLKGDPGAVLFIATDGKVET